MGTAKLVLFVALCLVAGTRSAFFNPARYEATPRHEDTTSLRTGVIVECRRPRTFPDFYIANDPPVPFRLVVSGFLFAEVRFTRPPDAELGDVYYEVEVVCDDGNAPGTAIVAVTILSRNEYAPYALHDHYSITFPESAMPGDVVSFLRQHDVFIDEDGGRDGELNYTTLDDPPNPYLSLNSSTGEVTLLQQLDYDTNGSSTTTMYVHACDRSTDPILCPNATISFSVTPVNEFDPVFSPPVLHVTVPEGFLVDHVVATVSCSDADVGEGSYGGMEVNGTSPELAASAGAWVRLSPDTANGMADILLTAALDYDFSNKTTFEVVVRCYDSVSVPEEATRSGFATVFFQLEPVNEFRPQFTAEWYNTSVIETVPVGSSLLTVQCSDLDRDKGVLAGVELYQPSAAVNSTFLLHPDTGVLTLSQTLDYDDVNVRSYIFTVRCYDDGGLDALAKISLSTLPASDEQLIFLQPVFEFSVERITDINSRIGQILVEDGDKGEVPVITFSIELNPLFDIDDEGYIILIDYLTADKDDFFNLTVTARDSQGPVRAQVEVSVTGLLSSIEIIYVTVGVFGLLIVVIIGVLIGLCSYFCWKLYRIPHDGDDTVPVYMRGGTLPRSRPQSGHQRKHRNSSLGLKHRNSMMQQTTLSLQKPKSKPKSFKKRARKRPTVYDHDHWAVHDAGRENVFFGSPEDMNMFSSEGSKEQDEGQESPTIQNIFNPEDTGLLLEDLYMETEPLRWSHEEEDTTLNMGSWALLHGEEDVKEKERDGEEEEQERGSEESSEESEESGEWDVEGDAHSGEWDVGEWHEVGEWQDDDDVPLTHI